MSHPCTPSENCNFTRLNGGRNDLGRKSQKFTIRLNNTISLEHFFSCSTDFFLQQPGKCDPFCATCPMGLMCSVSIWLATVLLLILLLGLGLHRNTLIAPPPLRGAALPVSGMLGAAGSGSAARVPHTTGGRKGGVGTVLGRETCKKDGGSSGGAASVSLTENLVGS